MSNPAHLKMNFQMRRLKNQTALYAGLEVKSQRQTIGSWLYICAAYIP